ncbi:MULTISPECIES: polyhydroxyalkanoate depolymerase [unclassified Rhizobium]|jgi:polyhydroxyalkanoate depolymerase|uniref:polyhydroxyalkanoate depolymerase n=1 Tax=unclassified Rhizobium TaxID=2613769 RepID=UPI0016142EAD|nr:MULTISPECIES: polyhydroxyalkanoate depolymerase [unclassified Rhizobium]MBB3285281.1 polyhydroxyalkanoate depolymerase [Rhizobium sp. BK252]MBB3400020.1 polyhydroxyalkanoate depolymerase [Rhizobium sp. BK289]MBB3412600.1 polyhydroxyalkanoate depolymerase [Rhizobium sp. BK284]MBB3480486.1 polyhydroxyalkanoate depolymerase [Rhizobium sp. BK347]MDK4719156.1 polyhydroxyalkanoate depolymerase [Rhizobium sp. CNPSo 3968]
MLYQAYQFQDDFFAPIRDWARRLEMFSSSFWSGDLSRYFEAAMEMISRFQLTHERPDFAITSVTIGNREVPITLETALDLPFGKLLHFSADVDTRRPRVLVVAPLSGHFSTLLRGTVQTLLRDHDVYITDWTNARDVPLSAGRFGMDDYVDYIIRFLEEIGPGGHILAVCQPCVQALVAVAVMSEARHPATPRTMTLMAGPVDPRESPTKVNELAVSKSLAWFETSLISCVPLRFAGGGRRVYPGVVQLSAFMSMNMERHQTAHRKLFEHLAKGETAEAEKIKTFYNEYFAVLDLTEEFYLETIDRVFQKAELAMGEYTHRGRKVDPGLIRNTALLTVEGGRDDICALGQTSAAHDLCRSLRPHLKRHHLQANVGHYGVFNGRRWEKEIYPVVRNMILAME